MINPPTNIQTVAISGGIRITWEDNSDNEHGFEVWRKVDSADYELLTTTAKNIETYDDMDLQLGTVKYKVRAKGAESFSSYATKDAPAPLEFVFTSTGDGSGLGVFNIEVSEETTMTIDGSGKFYTDLAGTEGESTSVLLTTTGSGFNGNLNRIYIKVPSGIATLRVKNVVTKWGEPVGGGSVLNDGWDTYCYGDNSSSNCPSVSIDVATMIFNTSINVFGLNTLYGDLSGNSIMTYMEIADGTPNHTTPGHGGATVVGDISSMPLVTFDCWDDTHFTGLCESADMEVIWCNGLNEVTFNVSEMPKLRTLIELNNCSCNIIGDISLCPEIAFVQSYHCSALNGSINGLTNLQWIQLFENSSVTATRFNQLTKLDRFQIKGLSLSSAVTNQLLADLWANKDTAGRVYNTRTIELLGTPTGQGITDKTNLQAYRTPNNEGDKALWTINTL